jgi:hypothetical protein
MALSVTQQQKLSEASITQNYLSFGVLEGEVWLCMRSIHAPIGCGTILVDANYLPAEHLRSGK